MLSSIAHHAKIMATRTMASQVRYASSDAPVAFVGLGNMGKGMARNLMKNGFAVSVFDTNPAARAELQSDGATVFNSPAEAAEGAKAVVTMVPIGKDVDEVYNGNEGVLKTMGKGTVCIDSSTIDVETCQRVGAQIIERGGSFIDAPVSGGQPAAIAGNLIFMCGGTEEHFELSQPYLQAMGQKIIHCGPLGKGLVVKLCNNMQLGMSMIAISETLNMGINMGMDAKLLTEVLLGSSGQCFALQTFNPVPGVFEGVPSTRGYTGGFGSALMLKDLGLAQEAAAQSGSATPLGKMAQEIYAKHSAAGFAEQDFSSVIEYIKARK